MVIGHPSARLLGYVQMQVASRVYVLPVEARRLQLDDGSMLRPGLFEEGSGNFGIRVDSDASAAVVKETIDQALAEAAYQLSQRYMN
jgi:hypothetical protein